MKTKAPLIATLVVSLLAAWLWRSAPDSPPHPKPTNGTMVQQGEEEDGRTDKRKRWLESLHRAAPGTNWRMIEYQNRMRRHRERADRLQMRSDCGFEPVADGLLQGQWSERGSLNQAGSVFDTEYDPSTDDIWLISAGGTLFKGHLSEQIWEVVNQDLRFTPGLLHFIPTESGRRMVAFAHRLPHYSDDDGYTWQAAEGIAHEDRWGDIHHPIVLNDSLSTVYVLAKTSYWEPIELYRSSDGGESYSSVRQLDSYNFNNFALTVPHGSSTALLMEKGEDNEAKLYTLNTSSNEFELTNSGSTFNFGGARANITGVPQGDSLLLYVYAEVEGGSLRVMKSVDSGLSWEAAGDLPIHPWSVGLQVSPSDPSHLTIGAVECYHSADGGSSWEKVNNWYDYYNDTEGSLHADMMHFSEFETAEGLPFMLISNHGGLSVSYDRLATTQNIGLSSLNVSQYYSVRTDPLNPEVVYAGSQDQGFQRSVLFGEAGLHDFEQVISGDYGHIEFSNNGQYLWTVYPGGWVTLYTNPTQSYLTASYDVESENESVWLPPLCSGPTASDRGIYMAGGSVAGGEGSHLIRLDWDAGELLATQGDFDFADATGGEGVLSAMDASAANPDFWYAATTNGRFFYSHDDRQSWEQSINFIPSGHYLYGQAVLASAKDSLRVVLAGSGYSNPPVYLSIDGGANFSSMSEGLPNTMVYDLATNADEDLLFAATEAGPYLYVAEDGRWYAIAGTCAPVQTYWSVEFLEEEQIARFGTYGRGIWDFQIDRSVPTKAIAAPPADWRVWPNPSPGQTWLSLPAGPVWTVQLFDHSGQLVQQWERLSGEVSLQLSHLPKGAYFLQAVNGQGRQAEARKLLLL